MGEGRRVKVLQRDEAGDKERALGNRLKPGDDERGEQRDEEDEIPGYFHQHHAAIGVQNRRPCINLQ